MRILLFLLLLTFPILAHANWKAQVIFAVDGQNWRANKIEFKEGEEKTLNLGNYLLKLTLRKNKQESGVDVDYLVLEKKKQTLVTLTKGSENIQIKKQSEIYAKGEPNQPHSIITFKFQK